MAAQRVEAVGRLRMNVPLSFGVRFIAPLLPAFHRRYPKVEVELGLSDAQHGLIQEGWDLAIRIGHLADSSLKARRLGDCPMRVCAAPDYLERYGTPGGVAELSGHNCLSYTLSPSQREGTWSFGREGDIQVPVQGDLKANNGDALLAAALGGQGVIYQPNFIVGEALARGTLVALELDQPQIFALEVETVFGFGVADQETAVVLMPTVVPHAKTSVVTHHRDPGRRGFPREFATEERGIVLFDRRVDPTDAVGILVGSSTHGDGEIVEEQLALGADVDTGRSAYCLVGVFSQIEVFHVVGDGHLVSPVQFGDAIATTHHLTPVKISKVN